MYCLYNGEYGEHDLSFVPGLKDGGGIVEYQREQYQHYVGSVVGDFTCLNVEYDWGKRDQRWTIKCNLCGKITYQYHTKDWRRGKGRTILCECRKEKVRKDKIITKQELQKQKVKEIEEYKHKYVGKEYKGWIIKDVLLDGNCVLKCATCGSEKMPKKKIKEIIKGRIKQCSCDNKNDYSGSQWIGKRNGHLTVIGRNGGKFITRCDCGNERIVRPVEMFTYKTVTSCNEDECPYTRKTQIDARERRKAGSEWEYGVLCRLLMKGYDAELVAKTGDFGVDIIITNKDGSKMAIQCKNYIKPTGVSAVQEVYAGGRFYDCTQFAVISASMYTNNAIVMAKKLGVYLSDDNFEYPKDMNKYCENLMPVHNKIGKNIKTYEIDGEQHTLAGWCLKYHISTTTVRKRMKSGVQLRDALTMPVGGKGKPTELYTIDGFTGSLSEICEMYNIIPETVKYRMKYRNMTLEEALKAPKHTGGR